ncbi:dUTP diphosphatase [Micavibrio aeruginosavorus]|uniref:Deoxyuridine 5'-triphosphate nucleotidohydrolase n=1 Tax=Micavibrio aeruginosavorus EPB TaxID=349215 RepID=M4VE95_9BACT|nr:dUTP diphosphatase [Micavibrio aeruginosavorus]AGH97697.1 Deoxyuridine 5'-triphosphate nucleotidohydrolase [Micavibrio aeruginosavorus EPB]
MTAQAELRASSIGNQLDHVGVSITRLPHAADLPLPSYATEQSAGMDLCAAIDAPLTLAAGQTALVSTGLAIALPAGFEAQVRPRSGLAAKNGVTVLNSPGTIDADYRGEIKAILINHGPVPFVIERGMRIAQMVIARHATVTWTEVTSLDETARGAGGFGSTGTK